MTVKLIFVNEEPVYTQNITEDFFPELILFISKHSSASGIPTLSVHTPGNLSKAELGGLPRKVSISPASAMKSALLEMIRLKDLVGLDYEVSYECTHHGPSLDIPTMFVELGSAPAQWTDQKASEVVASAAMAAISNRIEYPTVLGIGGPHYNRRFTKIALTSAEAFGHIVPKYEIPQMDFEILKHCIQQTLEKVESAVFDWKGMKSLDKQRLITMLNELNIPIIRA
jgi:D-aminoacyl-tRNA deacylase